MKPGVMGNQTVRQAAMLEASQLQARRRRERVDRDRRVEKLAVEVLAVHRERDAIAATEKPRRRSIAGDDHRRQRLGAQVRI